MLRSPGRTPQSMEARWRRAKKSSTRSNRSSSSSSVSTRAQVTLEASFQDDLDADSLDLVELIMELEDQFGVKIPDEEAQRHQDGQPGRRLHHGERLLAPSVPALATLVERLPDELRRRAFTHSSWVDERVQSYERLEFLGDGVLGLAVAEELYRRAPGRRRGSARAAARLRRLAPLLRDRRADARSRGRVRAGARAARRRARASSTNRNVLAALCESVIGAAFLHYGYARPPMRSSRPSASASNTPSRASSTTRRSCRNGWHVRGRP